MGEETLTYGVALLRAQMIPISLSPRLAFLSSLVLPLQREHN